MALIQCKECNAQVSTEAKTCPHCGAKVENNFGCTKVLGVVFAFLVLASLIGGPSESDTTEQPTTLTPEQQHKKRIESGFSGWDGSHKQLTKIIKESMHDPDSYDHVKTTYIDTGKDLIIETTYRGKNAYGGLVLNKTNAKASYDGQVTSILK